MTTPELADYGVTRTYGNLRGRLAAGAIQYGTDSPFNHAVIYVGGGQIVEAEPGGARVAPWDRYDPDSIVWSTGRLELPWKDEAAQRKMIADSALMLVGTPYGWADIACIALAQKRLGTVIDPAVPIAEQPHPWREVLRRVESSRKLICSQLVDLAYHLGRAQLFDDGRFPGMVSPGDLYRLLHTGRPGK